MHVVLENNAEQARELVDAGYCPVEASFGDQRSVAHRAWLEHYGARADDPRFAVADELNAEPIRRRAVVSARLP